MESGRRLLAAFLVPGGLALLAPCALADSFRCDRYIIREGMAASEVREKCGAPDLIRKREEPVFSRLENGSTARVGTTVTDFWFYGRGPNEFVVQVAVRESIAEEITLLTTRDIEALPDE
jgi:Protein of unknown function (DUF2845)